MGRCSSCGAWNSLENIQALEKMNILEFHETKNRALKIEQVKSETSQRIITGVSEFDRVMGGGIVPGSLTLVGGDPGVGKSTLLTNVLGELSKRSAIGAMLYISGEESASQVAQRVRRLNVENKNVWILHENELENIFQQMDLIAPKIVVLDSIQTTVSKSCTGGAGSASQIKEVTHELMSYVKSKQISCFVIGHVTKDGAIAGPKLLEHMVDTVIYFEGEKMGDYRFLRAVKNRFGQVQEVGLFEMGAKGLVSVTNPQNCFTSGEQMSSCGRCHSSLIEGSRVLFIEVQALTLECKNGMGRRVTQGLDSSRLSLLLAVMEKYMHTPFSLSDIYVNLVGGVKVSDRCTDLAIVAALWSSWKEKNTDPQTLFLGEVGLTGEVRAAVNSEQRIREAQRLGYKKIVTAASVLNNQHNDWEIKIIEIDRVEELCQHL